LWLGHFFDTFRIQLAFVRPKQTRKTILLELPGLTVVAVPLRTKLNPHVA
jgi:hypothetical protein